VTWRLQDGFVAGRRRKHVLVIAPIRLGFARVEVPETRYARSGEVNIAYQVFGAGDLDLVYVPGWVSHVEEAWESREYADFLVRLGSFARVLMFDKRGTGLSDRVAVDRLPTLEERMDDVRAVLDAAQSRRAAVFGVSEGGNMSVLFAATFPERTSALITYGIYAKRLWSEDYPWAPRPEEREREIEAVERDWARLDPTPLAPQASSEQLAWVARYIRRSASPGAAAALLRMNTQIDVRAVLPTIAAPTLVLHRTNDRDVRLDEGRWIASQIPGARFVELPGDSHLPWLGGAERVTAEIEEFLTGVRTTDQPTRVLSTILFTDLVGSTTTAVELGDARWRELLARHHAVVRRELARHRGAELDSAGDGFFAHFDGPARAIRCATAIVDGVRTETGLDVRAGIHTGECEILGEKLAGIAVHIGSRIATNARAGEVLVSSTVKDLVAGSGIGFENRGVVHLKGLPGKWELYRPT
jgi:pimeloyl-ACP methyl ester carboxylesterase